MVALGKVRVFHFQGSIFFALNIRFFLCLCITVYLTREEDCFALVVQVVHWRDALQFTA